jgi:3-phenylpropionate/trans-cinnamate dioxygenase ferredoxin reductase subunit
VKDLGVNGRTDSGPAARRVVVVGAGLAGLRAVERLRHRGFSGELLLLGAERHLPYDRPPLSKHLLRGERDDTSLKTAEELDKLGVMFRPETPATHLNVAAREVRTHDGRLPYDVLIVASGATPRRVGMGGMTLRTLDDAMALRAALVPGGRLAVIGAGLIGCEVSASARTLGVDVDVIDVLPGPAIRVLGPTVAELLARVHSERGVRWHLGTGVARAQGSRLVLDNGVELAADVVLEAVGVVPDTRWLEDSGLSLDDGVECDLTGCAAEGVYAVGDVARWGGRRHEHWTNVGHQADIVAAAILGQELPGVDVAYWWSDQYDLKLQGLGAPAVDDDVALVPWGPKQRTLAIYSRDGRVSGAVGFSAAGGLMPLRNDIAAGTQVTDVLAKLRT